MRVFIGWLVIALLVGCDRDDPPRAPASVEAPPSELREPAKSSDSEPVPEPLAPEQASDEPPPIEIEAVAEPDEPPAKPELKVRVRPAASSRKAPAAPSEEPLDPPKLDLSLPDDWVQAMEEGEPVDSPLLPPLFAAPEQAPSMQVSGRLIPRVEDDETVIDGAQLDFEFRR